MLKAILARDDEYGIGKKNGLPWPHQADDMKHFKDITDGHIIVMGANTWRSIGETKLKGRKNIVLRSDADATPLKNMPDDIYFGNMFKVIQCIQSDHPRQDIFIIGGAFVYNHVLPLCNVLYETHIHGKFDCTDFVDDYEIAKFALLAEKPGTNCTFMMKGRR